MSYLLLAGDSQNVPPTPPSGSSDPRDLYKSIILRKLLPRNFNQTRDSVLAKVMASLGEADNGLGGLFGKANFFGETIIVSAP